MKDDDGRAKTNLEERRLKDFSDEEWSSNKFSYDEWIWTILIAVKSEDWTISLIKSDDEP